MNAINSVVGVSAEDSALLEQVIEAVHKAGNRLLEVYSPAARPADRDAIFQAGQHNEEISLSVLQDALQRAWPAAKWVADEQETSVLEPGEWWVVDTVEGNVNHVHGLPEWGVSVTLLRNDAPVLAVFYQPIGNLTYWALRGAGAYLNGQPLRTSAKTNLADAVVLTGQAEANQTQTYQRIGDSITTMLSRGLLVRATVPSTFPMLLVAGGHFEVFWQYEPVLSGVAAGVLLITEAGGIVSQINGQPWHPGSPTILATAPHLHAAALDVLSTID